MDALMSPTSPEAYRKETSQVYAAGWPPAFIILATSAAIFFISSSFIFVPSR